MKVTIDWSEQVSYSSTIEVDEADVRDALELPADAVLTEAQVREFLEDNDFADDWFEQCDTNGDFVSVDERQIDELTLLS